MCKYTNVDMSISMYTYMYTCKYIYIYIYTYQCIYIYMHICDLIMTNKCRDLLDGGRNQMVSGVG